MTALTVTACSNDTGDATPTPVYSTTAHDHPLDPGVETTEPPSEQDAWAAAQGFLDAFSATDRGPADWYAEVERWCYGPYADLLADTDPSNIPFTEVTGELESVTNPDDPANRSFAVQTDTGVMVIHVGAVAGEWRVYSTDWEPTE